MYKITSKQNVLFNYYIKRFFDLTIAFAISIVAIPILLTGSILVLTTLGRPIFFNQKRPGKNGKIFRIWKLRTMSNEKDESGSFLPDDQRLKKVGKVIRALSIDELPQLYNVLRGEMSLVGPRPLLVEYLDIYTEEEMARHSVLPGITGWAQVNGRNAITWKEKLALDVWYVQNWNFFIDIKIIILTITRVFKKSNLSKEPNIVTKYNGCN